MKKLFGLMFLCGMTVSLHAQVTVAISFDPGSGIASGSAIQLSTFKIGTVQPGISVYAGGGSSAGKSQFTPLTLYKNIDATTPLLFLDCALGKKIKSATLTVSQDSVVLFQILMEGVAISSVNEDSTYSDGGPPLETVALSYTKIGWQYTPSSGPPVNGGFDLQTNVVATWSQLVNQISGGN
jgi:type VI secretion system secreted protein Hcp